MNIMATAKSNKKSQKKLEKKLMEKKRKMGKSAKDSSSVGIASGISKVALNPVENSTKLEKSSDKSSDKIADKVPKQKIKSLFASERVLTENSNEARDLFNQSRFGTLLENGQVQLSLHEALYLIEKGRLEVMDEKKKPMSFDDYLKRAKKIESNFWIRYVVFKDMRNRGYIIKTALKFGADFRVYDRGVKPGDDHAKWIVYPVHEATTMTWYDFSAKNRVAHSTKKRLMLAVVDEEADVTYWEVNWLRP